MSWVGHGFKAEGNGVRLAHPEGIIRAIFTSGPALLVETEGSRPPVR